MHRDTTIDPAKARHLSVIWAKKVKKLAKQTAFNEDELQALCLIFHKICDTYAWWGSDLGNDRVDRLDRLGFRDGMSALLDMCDSKSLDALFAAQDTGNKRFITATAWIKALDAIKGSDENRALLCWHGYTSSGDDTPITRYDMAAFTKDMFVDVGQDDFGGSSKEFVDAMLTNTKAGKSGVLPLKEYLDIVSERPLFTEFLRTILPSKDALRAFLATFSPPPPPRPRRRRPCP